MWKHEMEERVRERILTICDELGEDMDSPSCQALQEYVKSCPNCAAFVDSVKKTIRLYRQYSPEPSGETQRRLSEIVDKMLRENED